MINHQMERGSLAVDHVDVFASRALAGNGLTVVTAKSQLAADTMLRIAQELRQFETIFLHDVHDDRASARIFTPEEELDFAGHPVLGAAAVLHRRIRPAATDAQWTITVGGRPLAVHTSLKDTMVVWAEMDQGRPHLMQTVPLETSLEFAAAAGLEEGQLRTDLPA